MALLEKECKDAPKDCACGNCYGVAHVNGNIEIHYCNGDVARVEKKSDEIELTKYTRYLVT